MNRIKPYVRYIAGMLAGVCVMLSLCSSESNHNDNLDNAQVSIDNNDYRTARSICDDVLDKESKNDPADAEIMARLSVLYMKLADHNDMSDKEDNLDYAYECYERAFDIDSVKARHYYLSLSMEDMPQVALLESIVKNSKIHPDSLGVDFTEGQELNEFNSID